MSNNLLFEPPEVTDKDIHWASRVLTLPDNAFYGNDGTDPRQEALKSMESIDIAACPGSGKTTLLVAKLAILAEKWQYRTHGICVLSHTNVARNEIETRLGNTTTGRRLLSYPHYIGTIHGFINEFLAVPWLRSRGYPIKLIDSEICEKRRWNKLDPKWRFALKKQHIDKSNIRILDTSYNLGKRDGQFPFANHTDTYLNVSKACQETAREGYYCYDDMFIWAHDMMDKLPQIVEVIRDRFPLLFVDEAQDNSEDQSAILYRIFKNGGTAVIRQRLGDGNQAIFDFIEAKEATTDKFPNDSIKRDLPNSHRFGQNIANLADPLGLIPYGLIGQGPQQEFLLSGESEGPHTIFLFDNNRANKVLEVYAEMLINTFSEQALREGTFSAVGQVHRPPDGEEDRKFPHHIGHYWPDYDPEMTKTDPKPNSFIHYVFAGQAKTEATGEVFLAVEKITDGILRLAGMVDGGATFHWRRHGHRYIMELLQGQDDIRARYLNLVTEFAVEGELLTKDTWDSHWCYVVREIAETIAGASLTDSEANEFLAWKDETGAPVTSPISKKSRDNIYRFSKNGKEVAIRVGSIHSVKGETHTSTLVLETFWHGHNMASIRDWLFNDRKGCDAQGVRIQDRLKLQYVAMTRPSHMVCLAMKRSICENDQGDLDQDMRSKMEHFGWQVEVI